MKRESIEELRQRLLRDNQVQEMISMRAYEIYRLRGSQPGREAEDWFQAENEILGFLIEEESRIAREDEKAQRESEEDGAIDIEHSPDSSIAIDEQGEGPRAFVPRTTPEIAERPGAPVAQTAEERADAQSPLGVWSPTEPESAQRAPEIGSSAESAEPTKKKTRSRATSRTASKTTESSKGKTTARKPSTTRKSSATKESKPPAKKASAAKKSTAKKPAAKRASSKKKTETDGD